MAAEPESTEPTPSKSGIDWVGLISVILLSVTAILTAWAGFQASKWGGAMSISFAQASTARLESAALAAQADRTRSLQIGVFAQYLQAKESGDDEAARALAERTKEPLATAFRAWLATKPFQNPDAPESPFDMPEYALTAQEQAKEAAARADALFAEGLENNQRGDNYTILVVLGAVVLFFAALSTRMAKLAYQWILLGTALVLFAVMIGFLISFPKLV